jgi:hypothetical protein
MYCIVLVLIKLGLILEVIIGTIEIWESTREEVTYAAVFQNWF